MNYDVYINREKYYKHECGFPWSHWEFCVDKLYGLWRDPFVCFHLERPEDAMKVSIVLKDFLKHIEGMPKLKAPIQFTIGMYTIRLGEQDNGKRKTFSWLFSFEKVPEAGMIIEKQSLQRKFRTKTSFVEFAKAIIKAVDAHDFSMRYIIWDEDEF